MDAVFLMQRQLDKLIRSCDLSWSCDCRDSGQKSETARETSSKRTVVVYQNVLQRWAH